MDSKEASLQPVTRIRGQLELTADAKDAISRFLQKPIDPDKMPSHMYTSAQAIVGRKEFYSHQYDEEIRDAEKTCQELADKAFRLSTPLKIREFPNGTGQLLFSVQNHVGGVRSREYLDTISDKINNIPSLEETAKQENMLYVELVKGALNPDKIKRISQIRLAHGLIKAELNDPVMAPNMRVRRPGIVTMDTRYPVRLPYYLPTDDRSGHV